MKINFGLVEFCIFLFWEISYLENVHAQKFPSLVFVSHCFHNFCQKLQKIKKVNVINPLVKKERVILWFFSPSAITSAVMSSFTTAGVIFFFRPKPFFFHCSFLLFWYSCFVFFFLLMKLIERLCKMPYFQVISKCGYCGKTQFPHSFEQIARNYAEIVPLPKISTPENYVKLRYFKQCLLKILTHSCPFLPLYTPWKHKKTNGFLGFSGGIEWEHWFSGVSRSIKGNIGQIWVKLLNFDTK